jgi:hypothetical protein
LADARGFETAYFALRCAAAAQIRILMRALEVVESRAIKISARLVSPRAKDFGAKRATAKKFARGARRLSAFRLIIEAMNLGADGEDKLGELCV